MPRLSPRARTTLDKEIGLRIRALRTDQKMSQQALAKSLKLTFQQIQKYEKGSNRIATTRLMDIARLLNTTPHELMGWGNAARLGETATFDRDAYRLAKVFMLLPDKLKTQMRLMIETLVNDE
jgi:transcriptional regulator with XRE-family HTH domain